MADSFSCFLFDVYNTLLNNPHKVNLFFGVFLLAAVSTCVINSTSEKVVFTQASGGVTCSSSSGGPSAGGEDESRSEGGGNGSQQQPAVPSSPSTRKSFFKKNIEDGMDRYVITESAEESLHNNLF